MISRHFAGFLTLLLASFLHSAHPLAASTAGDVKVDDAADPSAKVQKLNRYAMQLFDDLNFTLAEKTLLEALSIVEKSNLGKGPAGLATNGNLAVLYSIGLKNPDKAVHHFKKALAIKPDLKMSKQRATPETEANLARAKAEMSGGSAPTTASPHKPAEHATETKRSEPAATGPMKCPTDGEVQAGEELTLKCQLSTELNPSAVMLYYKPNGSDQYQALAMTKAETSDGNTTWVGKIPGSETKGKWVPVYFEARNEAGRTLALSSREASPSVIMVRGAEEASDKPPMAADGEEGEEGEEGEDVEEIDDSNPLARLEKERWREHQGSKGTWWIGLGFGSGIGYASGKSTEAFGKFKVGFNPGFAIGYLGHAVPEIGIFLGRSTALALTGRNQWVPGGPKGTATGAHTLLLRILFFTDDTTKVRWYFAGAAGAGEGFRFQVEAQVLDANGASNGQTVKDTVRGGPYVAGVGGGMLYKINRRWRWTLDTQVLVGFPHYSGILDLTTGIRILF
jgi:hypothetical protein